MPDIEQLVDFLERRESLRLGESPWQPPADDSEVHELDWDSLFAEEEDEAFGQNELNDRWPGYSELADTFGPGIGRRPEPSEGKEVPVIESATHFCAWYQPIHFHGYDFGIFIRQECARKWAQWVSRFMPAGTPLAPRLCRQFLRAGVYVLFLHEHYHHKVESLGLRLHVAAGMSCFLPYHAKVYRPCIGSDDQLEEALANADAYLRLREPRYRKSISPPVVEALREYLCWSYPHCPPGYRKAIDFIRDDLFDAGEDALQERVRLATLTATGAGDWVCAPQMTRSILTVRAPIWWLVPPGSRPLVPVKSAPIRTCTSDELVTLCERRGYQKVDGGKGSHVKMKRPNSPMVIIPGDRRNVSPGSARSTLKALGIQSLAELPELVRQL
jgi:predicted RNA binding protein YcfA (HicA-like mRNA interferase family)